MTADDLFDPLTEARRRLEAAGWLRIPIRTRSGQAKWAWRSPDGKRVLGEAEAVAEMEKEGGGK